MKRFGRVCLAGFVFSLLLTFPALAGTKPSGEKVSALLKGMSLEEKAGQVLMGFFRGETVHPSLSSVIGRVRPGGWILYSSTGNIVSLEQVAGLTASLQEAAAAAQSLPPFVAVDQEGGRVSRLTKGVTVFPGNMALGATGDPDLAAKAARITSRELRILGITVNFAPVVDVQSNPANPVIGTRSFGSDPALVARMATAMVAPAAEEGVLCTAKHFPGHGNTSVDSHAGLPIDTHPREILEKVNFVPFSAMVRSGVPAIMTAHVVMPDLDQGNVLPATLLPKAYAVLRGEMGFSGLAVTDSLGMKALDRYWSIEETAVLALQAGADLLVLGADPGHEPEEIERVHRAIVSAVLTDRIPKSRLDEAVKRILQAKETLNILDDPGPRTERLGELASHESLALADAIARRALTLAWNRFARFPAADGERAGTLLWPLEKADQARVLLETCPSLKPQYVPLSAPAEDIAGIVEGVEGDGPVYTWAGDLGKYPAWRDLARALGKRSILLVTGSPYGLALCPEAGAAVVTYSEVPVSLKVLGDYLRAPWTATGKLPVAIHGL
ncbi:MAG: glycoside hydrolase family 3 protein [Synergistales bacterium]|jgi:beta-N-acetylhexosaminidase